jgi:crotonobetainyl-CoA:carnitine CoA-transferase CaiB-like acyl-CoA transferase
VLDLTQNVAGLFCTQVLGDFGAEVIKIERPGRGDDTRLWEPSTGEHSATFLALNRNKKSLCVDLDQQSGVEVLHRLAESADVVVHSMKPGSAEARGLGYEAFRLTNPALVYCAISAFGQVGPLRALPGYDPLMQAFTGIMSSTGNDGQDPVRVGVSLIDMGTGMWAAMGIVGAILDRTRSGRGMAVEASLLETGISWMTVLVAGYQATGKLPRKLGSAVAMTAPYELYACADGYVFIAAGNDNLFRRVSVGLGHPALAEDPRFASNALRVGNRAALRDAIEALTRDRPGSAIIAALRAVGAPCSEMHDVAQMLDHEQVAASGILADLPVDGAANHKVVATPLKVNGERSGAMRPPPARGADSDAVLAAAGYGGAAIDALRNQGAID